MPPSVVGSLSARSVLRAWCLLALLLCASAALLALPQKTEAEERFWPSTTPSPGTFNTGQLYFGLAFESAKNGVIKGAHHYFVSGHNTNIEILLYNLETNTLLATRALTAASGAGWQRFNFDSPIPVMAGVSYQIVIGYGGSTPFTDTAWNSGLRVGNLYAYSSAEANALSLGLDIDGQGQVGDPAPPTQAFNENYWIDPIFETRALVKPPNNLGLVGYWSFNEGTSTTATDFSGNRKVGILNGSNGLPTWVSGKRGKALNFDGIDDYVEVASPNLPTGDFTYTAWIYDADPGIYHNILTARDNVFEWQVDNNVLRLLGLDAPTAVIPIQANTWTHVAVRRSGSAVTFLVNGVQEADAGSDASALDFSTCALVIGVDSDSGGCPNGTLNGFWVGKLDELRVYNRPLSNTEVQNIYKSGAVKFTTSSVTLTNGTTLQSGLVGHWTFDGGNTSWTSETTGTTRDLSGAGNTGTLTSMNRNTSVSGGKLGQAFSFNGATDYVQMGDISSTDSQSQLTWSFWVYQTSFTDQRWYIGKGNPNGETQMSWAVLSEPSGFDGPTSDTIAVTISSALASSDLLDICSIPTAQILLNQWMHVAVVYDGTLSGNDNRVNVYTNGVYRPGAGNCIGTYPAATTNSSANVRIGDASDGTRNQDAKMDDVRIYNRVLTAAEIKQLSTLGQVIIRP